MRYNGSRSVVADQSCHVTRVGSYVRINPVRTVHGRDGLRIGAGDRIVTRENDNRLGVANRMTWTVQAVQPDGALELTRPGWPDPVTLNPDYVRENIHLAYASTVHGVQGQTSDHGRLHLTEMTDAAALYVGLTRAEAATLSTSSPEPTSRPGNNGSPPAAVTAPTSALPRHEPWQRPKRPTTHSKDRAGVLRAVDAAVLAAIETTSAIV